MVTGVVGQVVAEHLHPREVFGGRAALVALLGQAQRLLPFGGVVVTPADPGQRDERGLLVLVQLIDKALEGVGLSLIHI